VQGVGPRVQGVGTEFPEEGWGSGCPADRLVSTRQPGAGQRFRGGLVFKAHRLCVSLNSRLESNEEEKEPGAV